MSSESSPKRVSRRGSSAVNRVETNKETIFFNSPDEKNADIVHEIVPEIRIAKQVFEQPGTVEKVRQVSQQLKSADEAVITRRKSMAPISMPPAPVEDEVVSQPPLPEIKSPSKSVLSTDVIQIASVELVLEIAPRLPEIKAEPPIATVPVDTTPKSPINIDVPKTTAAINVSTVDTPTTILSRNVMYKEDADDETSSDSSSSESDVSVQVDSNSPNPMGSSPGKWKLTDICFCCWSRKR